MFNRAELKSRAKEVLSDTHTYWLSFAVCLIIGLVGGTTSFTANFSTGTNMEDDLTSLLTLNSLNMQNIIIVGIILSGIIVLAICFSIFLITPLNVGGKRFFIKSALGETEFSNLGVVFKSSYYLNVVKVMFMRNLFLILWALIALAPYCGSLVLMAVLPHKFILETSILLLVSVFAFIPFIMKSYSYLMVDYIVAQNPEIDWREAINRSKEMMRECRFQTFILELSFLGWQILGVMLCGVGVLFIAPYMQATFAQLYLERKNKVDSYGFCYEN